MSDKPTMADMVYGLRDMAATSQANGETEWAGNLNLAADTLQAMTKAALGIWHSKGCTCCEDTDKMETHEKSLAVLIGAEKYSDDSGYDLYTPARKILGLPPLKEQDNE